MTMFTRWIVANLAILLATCGAATAAEQTILGTTFTVKNPTGAYEKRGIIGVAKEKGSSSTIIGDPTLNGLAGGAVLSVSTTGGTPVSMTFTLPQGLDGSGKPFWKATGTTGYVYKDSKGLNGPVLMAQVKATTSGVFQMKIVVNGKLGQIEIVPPNPGTGGCFALEIGQDGSGDRYSAEFGPTSLIKNTGTKMFKASKPTAEGVCPASGGPTTTTTSTTAPGPTTTSSSVSTTTTDTIPFTTSTSTVTTTSTTTSTVGGPGIDANSPVASTSACITTGTGAQAAIQVTLFDTTAAPVSGATVAMNTTAGSLSSVQSSGNTYWATLTVPFSGASATVSVTANGTPLTTQPTITLALPLTDTTGGAGGCPQDGNLRVRVVDDLGLPIMGASVLVGQSELLNQYVTTFNSPADGATSATTDVSGYATFRDFGTTLSGPVTVTAGAASRQYMTIADANASDVVLPLRPIVSSVSTGTLTGTVGSISASSNVEVGVVLGDVTLDTLASFNLTSLLADNVCYSSPVGNFNVPNNVYIPSQLVIIFTIPQKTFFTAPLPFGNRRVVTLGGNVPVAALTGGGGIAAALTQLTFTNITAQATTVSAPGPTTFNQTVGAYGSTTACTATGAPGADAFCIAALDWDGNTTPTHNVGEGPLGVFSFKAGTATAGAVNLTGVNYKAKGAAAPNPFTTVGHMGATVSLFLDQTTAPPATGGGVSVVLKRDFPSDTLPSTFAYGAMYPIRSHSQVGRTLTLDVPAGLGTAQYVKHSLSQVISVAYSGCAANDSTRTTSQPLWDVYAPAADTSVTLPTLPASFPRATLGGNLPGLIDPTATAEDDQISWTATTIREGLNGAFNYDQLRMSGFRKYGTHFTTNSADYIP